MFNKNMATGKINSIKLILVFLSSVLTMDCSDLVQFHAEINGTSEQHYTVFLIIFDAEWAVKKKNK